MDPIYGNHADTRRARMPSRSPRLCTGHVANEIHFYVPDKAMQQHLERAHRHLGEDAQTRIEIHLDEDLARTH
jgi:hypothetical protein